MRGAATAAGAPQPRPWVRASGLRGLVLLAVVLGACALWTAHPRGVASVSAQSAPQDTATAEWSFNAQDGTYNYTITYSFTDSWASQVTGVAVYMHPASIPGNCVMSPVNNLYLVHCTGGPSGTVGPLLSVPTSSLLYASSGFIGELYPRCGAPYPNDYACAGAYAVPIALDSTSCSPSVPAQAGPRVLGRGLLAWHHSPGANAEARADDSCTGSTDCTQLRQHLANLQSALQLQKQVLAQRQAQEAADPAYLSLSAQITAAKAAVTAAQSEFNSVQQAIEQVARTGAVPQALFQEREDARNAISQAQAQVTDLQQQLSNLPSVKNVQGQQQLVKFVQDQIAATQAQLKKAGC